MGPNAVEKAEIVGLGGNLDDYQWARDVGCSHGECVEIVGMGVRLDDYWWARDVGCSHGECVEIIRLGGGLHDYWWARRAGVAHTAVVEAVTVHGLPAGLLNGFLERIAEAPDMGAATVVFETVDGVR